MTREDLRAAGEAEVARWEKAISDELIRLFDRQEAVVLARLRGTKARKHTRHWYPLSDTPRPLEVKAIIDPARWVKDAAASLLPIVERLFAAVYKRVAAQLEPDTTPAPPVDTIADAVQDRLGRVAEGVVGAAAEVEAYIEREEEAGSSINDMADGVQQIYKARKDSWAARISTLSAVGSINHAALLAAKAAGSSAKQWLSQRDQSVRPSHVHADGQVRLLDEKFRLGGGTTGIPRSLLDFPGDPSPTVPIGEVINCRCLLLFSPPRKGTKRLGPDTTDLGTAEHEVGILGAYTTAEREWLEAKDDARPCQKCGELLTYGVDGDWWSMPDGSIGCDRGGSHDVDLEAKARVRTAAGARQYGQPIGSVIVPNPNASLPTAVGYSRTTPSSGKLTPAPGRTVGRIGGDKVDDASADPVVRHLIEKYPPAGGLPDPGKTSVLALRDPRGRVGAYVVWNKADGQVLDVSVHPKLRGQRVGDQLVAMAMAEDPKVDPRSRPNRTAPSTSSTTPAPRARVRRPLDSRGLPVIDDRTQPGDQPGPSGSYVDDAARIDRLQQAYVADGADTISLFSRGGRFTSERHAEHEAIADEFLNRPGVKRDRKLLVMGGLPGAGKTTTIRSQAGQDAIGVDLDEYVVVNSDDVKEAMIARGMVPDYPGLSPEESATMIQAEAYGIACTIMRRAGANGSNIVYDATLRTDGTLSTATSALKGKGWKSTLVFVDVPLPVAKQRARARYAAGDRYVPEAFIDKMKPRTAGHVSLPGEVFDRVKALVDSWHHVDNAGADPIVLASGKGSRRARP